MINIISPPKVKEYGYRNFIYIYEDPPLTYIVAELHHFDALTKWIHYTKMIVQSTQGALQPEQRRSVNTSYKKWSTQRRVSYRI